MIGNALGVRFLSECGASRVQQVALISMLAGLAVWAVGTLLGMTNFTVALIATAFWGLGCFITNGAQQRRLLAVDTRLASAAVALNSSAVYLGQAFGAAAGGAMIAYAGAHYLAWVTTVLMVAALAVWRRLAQSELNPSR